MRRLARRTLALLTCGNGRFYVAGWFGVALGLGLMTVSVFLARNESIPPGSWRGFYLIFAGQVLATASGFLMGVPMMRRRQRDARRAAGTCPECGYDLRASPDRCPECGAAPAVTH